MAVLCQASRSTAAPCVPRIEILIRELESDHGTIEGSTIVHDNVQCLSVVIINKGCHVEILVFIHLTEKTVDKELSLIRRGIVDDRSKLIGQAKNTLESLKVLQSSTFDDVQMILDLAVITMCITVEHIDKKRAFLTDELIGKG